ncbi:MAG: trimeric intracellular cation channel family protein [Gemmatimonadota bacterium]
MDGLTSELPDFAAATPAWLGLLATFVGALGGALLGRQRSPVVDLAGMAVLAISLGFGGGVIRDLLLGELPPVALRDWTYTAAVAAALVVILLVGREIARFAYALFLLDALTLGLFAAVGAQAAIDAGLPALTAILVGSFASVGGGVIASVLLRETPAVMRPGPPYAIAAVAGALVFVLLDGVSGGLASCACVAVVLAIRIVVERAGLRTRPVRPIE